MMQKSLPILSLLFFSGQALASGFALTTHSASGQGFSQAGAAVNASDASIAWFNPAGLVNIEGTQMVVGASVILPISDFKNDGSTLFPSTPNQMPNFGGDGGGANAGFVPNFYRLFP